MAYRSLEDCLNDLERTGQLVRITEEVDPDLEMAAIHLRVHEAAGPALLFENIKDCRFRAASNIFGTLERSRYIFKDRLETIQRLIRLKSDPVAAFKNPIQNAGAALAALQAFPLKNPSEKPVLFQEIRISDLPMIKHWSMDGGAFVTLPQVYTEDVDKPGVMNGNLGMYRIQLNGNDYTKNEEIGLHYQLHRGIGVHHTKARRAGLRLKVSVFIGGPPAHSVAAVMPLPEGISELSFAGVLGGRRFRYTNIDGYTISTDADFVITGEVINDLNKLEGPFGDHLGYYSLQHPFPVLKVHKVYARKNAIWAFTLVGRPPQEDTSFGQLIHEMTGSALQEEIPGLKEVHAVDAAGVHPLLLAVGSERYTPFNPTQRPAEILTIANHILGTGQLSLAKFLFITATETGSLSAKDIPAFFHFLLSRIDLESDIHFYTNTTIDTLDYSGSGLNTGSKVVIAAYGDVKRELGQSVPTFLASAKSVTAAEVCLPGILVIQTEKFANAETTLTLISRLNAQFQDHNTELAKWPLIIIADDAAFVGASLNNFLWVTFTRCNPSHDIHGILAFTENKHWGCRGPLIIDARVKPHHAPAVEKSPAVENHIKQDIYREWKPRRQTLMDYANFSYMKLMKYSLLFLPVLLLNSCRSQNPPVLPTNGDGNTLLWQVTGKELKKPSYIFGTFHLLCKEDIAFSAGLKQAVKNSDEIYLEMDLDDPANTLGALFYMNMKDGKKLADLLPAEQYEKVTRFFKDSLGTGMMMVERMKPNFLQSLIFPKLLECKNMSGVEQELLTLAKTEKKEVKGFETIAFQSSVFDSIPYEEQAKDLVKMIDSLNEYSVYFEKMVKVYRSQKLTEIESLFSDPQFNMDEKSQDIMLGGRNRNWVSQLKSLLPTKSLFIGVGAGHLVGKNGLISLLKKEGYTLTPLKNN